MGCKCLNAKSEQEIDSTTTQEICKILYFTI